jgi:fatty-acyl-CoA synthase
MVNMLAPELVRSRPGHLDAAKLPRLRTVIQLGESAPGTIPFEAVYGMGGVAERTRLVELAGQLQFDEPINTQFTSGTTGLPKGATLTHHNILNNGYFLGAEMHYDENDKVCIPVPLYHCFGMVIGNLAHYAWLRYGAAREGFDPRHLARGSRATLHFSLYGVPTMSSRN